MGGLWRDLLEIVGAWDQEVILLADHVRVCGYAEKKLSGTTQKFECAIGDDVVKVRYGKENSDPWNEHARVAGEQLSARHLLAPADSY